MSDDQITDYSIEWLRDQFDDDRLISIRYGEGETGWALDLGNGRACIANSPVEDGLHYMDVVELGPPGWCSRPTIKRVIWRAYEHRTAVRYPSDTKDEAKCWYKQLFHACCDNELAIEGYISGLCMVSHHEDTDLEAVFRDAGIDVDQLSLEPDRSVNS
jgi:hypothetical protein